MVGPSVFGFASSCWKAQSAGTGLPYAVRRIENFRLPGEFALGMCDLWRQFHHPNVVSLREILLAPEYAGPNNGNCLHWR
jgi:PAB-dependent poly(A)-specific ribonuclease subunit 3